MNPLLDQLGNLFARYSGLQRVLISVIFIGIVSAIISLVIWANRPEFDILFADVEPTIASQIVSELRTQKIRYRIENNGRTIYVPSEHVSELRLTFAEEGLVGSAVPGYEVFDDQRIGMTSFMQQLNMRRALEGELTKTINQFPGVRNSRVHLVLPEGKLFEDDQHGSASVVLYLNSGRYVATEQVKGITALVANSVDGISPEDVVVVDSEGNLLSDTLNEEMVVGSSGHQWELRHTLETKLSNKVMDIVESVVGPRNAMVEVAIDLNFEQLERTTEFFDPDNVAIISEERHSESSNSSDSTSSTADNLNIEDVITNYELNKTVEHFVSNQGTINRISVAVLVNGRRVIEQDVNGEEITSYEARTAKELNQIAALVRSAVGYSEDRGDLIEVQNMQFDTTIWDSNQDYFAKAEKQAFYADIINKVLIGVAFLVAFLIIRGMLKSAGQVFALPFSNAAAALADGRSTTANPALLAGGGEGIAVNTIRTPTAEEEEIDADAFVSKLSPEARAKLKAKDRMTQEVLKYAKENPEDAAKLIRSWITSGKREKR